VSNKPKILVTREWPAAVEEALQGRYDVTLHRSPLDATQWREALQQYDAICPCVADRVSADIFSGFSASSGIKPRTRLLANYGVGYNHIDLEAVKAQGIVVTNTPDVLTDATADLAMTLMLMLARRAGEGERQLRRGEWKGWYPTHLMGAMVTGATLGIIGMGRIGLAMAAKAHYGFNMKILYHNRKPVNDPAIAAMKAEYCADMTDLLKRADFVALHCRGGPDTRHLLNAQRLALMQPHAFLINTSRGDVVDEAALIDALKAGRIAGAGLDVYEKEPVVPDALKAMENVVLLPHLGSATLETRTAMGMRVLKNVDAFFAGGDVPDRVV
jgi:lactate dehydrogenase-like 2-hydroxyacid dehydrogenase